MKLRFKIHTIKEYFKRYFIISLYCDGRISLSRFGVINALETAKKRALKKLKFPGGHTDILVDTGGAGFLKKRGDTNVRRSAWK
jgi:hypothetical protein